MGMSGLVTNVPDVRFFTWTFVTGSLVHIHEKEKIILEIAAKVAIVNEPWKFVLKHDLKSALCISDLLRMSILKEIFGSWDALQRCWNELYSFEIFQNLPYCAIVPPAFTNDNFKSSIFFQVLSRAVLNRISKLGNRKDPSNSLVMTCKYCSAVERSEHWGIANQKQKYCCHKGQHHLTGDTFSLACNELTNH